MKAATHFASATRTVGKLFFALALLLVAVIAGFGGTALVVYRHLDSGHAPATRNLAERKAANSPQDKVSVAKRDEGTRPVAAGPSDQPSYTYADNTGGQPSTPAPRVRSGATVPAALEISVPPTSTSDSPARLNDPESRFIVDSRTGRVVGIDGSAGARREEEEEKRRLEAAPRAVAVQTPPPEVRVASAVVEDGQTVYADGQQTTSPTSDSGNLPVRRALPVTADAVNVEPRNFNVAEYMASGRSRPVLRAQPVTVKTVRTYRLSDGSQVVAAD